MRFSFFSLHTAASILAGIPLAGIPLAVSGAAGQRLEHTLDVGGVAIRYADTLNGAGATLTPHLLADWGRGVADLDGTYSQFGSDWSLQGQAGASLFGRVNRFLGELAGFVGGSTHRDGSRTGEVLLNGRLHAQPGFGDLFLGVGAGRTSFGGESRPLFLGEAGFTRPIPLGNTTLTLTPVVMADSIRYADSQLQASWQRARVDVEALVGARVGDQLTALGGTARVWGNLNVTAWLTQQTAFVASAGSYPIDPTQGFPGGRFIAAAIRIAYPRRVVAQPDREEPIESPSVAAIRFVAGQNGRTISFRVLAPLARSVELAGDFTGWEPLRMVPSGDGWWMAMRKLSAGKYQMNLRLDGGQWVAPPGLLIMQDEFGGSVGLLIVQ